MPLVIPLMCCAVLSVIPIICYTSDVMTGVYQLYTSRKDPHPAYTELSLELEMHLMDNAGYWSPNGLDCEELRISFPFFIPKA